MWTRVLILLRARLSAQSSDAALPIAALLLEAFLAAAVCGLVRDEVPPFAYALVALATSAALIAMPLLGELAPLLSTEESADWVRALPVREFELHLARTIHLVLALALLSLGSLLPAALLAPASFDLVERAELVLLGLGQALAIAATLLALQSALRGRAQALLVFAQTALFVGVLVGLAVGLRVVPRMIEWHSATVESSLIALPPAWFAAPFSSGALPLPWRTLAPVATLAAVLALLVLPAPPLPSVSRGASWVATLLTPVRKLAARTWVARDERAAFEWLFDALPKEREFVLRTYPLLAVPVGFLWIGARGEGAATQADWLAMLFFIPGAYLPLLTAHVPASRSHRARWLVDSAPVERSALDRGALKAVAIRVLVPFYALIAALSCVMGGAGLAARLVVPGWLAAVIVMRATWHVCVTAPPLSTAPDELYVNRDWIGLLAGIAFGLCGLAVVAARTVDSWWKALLLVALLAGIELAMARKQRAPRLHPA